MRRLAVAFLLLLCTAPPAAARSRDFEVRVGSSATVRTEQRFDVFGVKWRRAPRHLHARVHEPQRGWRRWVEIGHAHSARG
nr:hypothetical protein [Actinomycetota bacterium]